VQSEGDERPVCVVRGLPQLGGGEEEKKEAERTVAGALKQKTGDGGKGEWKKQPHRL